MNESETIAALDLLCGLWPDWKATAAQRALWRELLHPYTLSAVKNILTQHRRSQREGKDFSPNMKQVSDMLDSFREYRPPDAIQSKCAELYYALPRESQAVIDSLMCRRALALNRFESGRDRDACELRLHGAQRTIEAASTSNKWNEAHGAEWQTYETMAVSAIEEIDTFARTQK